MLCLDAEIGCKAAPNWSGVIDVLFPASENTFTRPDKREVWQVDSDILMHAVVQWCDSTQRKSLGEGHYSLYTDLVEKLRKNPAGQAEVDDCLYIIMLQWAKLTSWNVKRSSMRSTLLEKDYPMDKFSLAMQKRRPSILAGKAVNSKDLLEKTSNNTLSGINNGEVKRESLSPLPLSNLKAMVESIYRPGEGPEIADPQFYATSYVNRLAIHRSHLLLPVESNNARGGEPPKRSLFSYGMERLLRDCVLWDTNSLSSYHRALLSLSSTAFEPKVDSKVAASVTASGVNSHFLHGNVGPIGSAVNPEIMIAAAKKACQAYQEVINQAITNV